MSISLFFFFQFLLLDLSQSQQPGTAVPQCTYMFNVTQPCGGRCVGQATKEDYRVLRSQVDQQNGNLLELQQHVINLQSQVISLTQHNAALIEESSDVKTENPGKSYIAIRIFK